MLNSNKMLIKDKMGCKFFLFKLNTKCKLAYIYSYYCKNID